MKILGLDWGERRLGFALSTEDHTWVFPWKVVQVRGFAHAISEIQKAVQDEKVERVVVGLPLGMGDTDTVQTSRVREVIADLQNVLTVPVEEVDERMTSQAAKRLQQDAGHAPAPVDAQAAVEILQTYLSKKQ
jgi:putative holliday junction resolvase